MQTSSHTLSNRISTTLSRSKKRRPLRVAFFNAFPENVGSGAEHLIYETVRALIARGHDARVYVLSIYVDKNPPSFEHPLPVSVWERGLAQILSSITGLENIFFPSTALFYFWRNPGSADIWHFHNLHGNYVSIPLLGIMSRVKRIILSPVDQYLTTGHCAYTQGCDRYLSGCGSCPRLDDPELGRLSRDVTSILWRIKRLFFRFSRLNMLFHTRALAEHYKAALTRYLPPCRMIYYGTDIHCYRPLPRDECAHKFGIAPSQRFVVGLLHSRLLIPRKGILPIIERLGDMARQLPGKMELLVVGRESQVVKDVVPPELPVTVLPYLHHAYELANALNLCDVLLYPTQAENLSLTCLDALACGVPVISYDAGGQKEAIQDGVNGFIVNTNDYEGMLRKLRKMIDNPALCQRLSEGARCSAETYFDFDRYIDNLIDYYYEIM